MASVSKPKSELSMEELSKREEEEFLTGPLSILRESVKNNTQIFIGCRDNRCIFANIKDFDKHMNMYLTDANVYFTFTTKRERKKEHPNQTRPISRMLLRGDNVVLVVPVTSAPRVEESP